MAPIEFYQIPESPPCRAVEMVASLVGVELKKNYVNLFEGEHLKEEFSKINPWHKVPFIVDGDVKIGESRAIMAYLVNKYGPADNSLYPSDPTRRAKIDELLFLDIGTIFSSCIKVFRPILKEGAKEINPESEKEFREVLAKLDKELEKSGKKFYIGDDLTIADISLAAEFSFLKSFEYDVSEFKSLTAYLNGLKASIPKYSEINDKPVENLANYIKSKLGK